MPNQEEAQLAQEVQLDASARAGESSADVHSQRAVGRELLRLNCGLPTCQTKELHLIYVGKPEINPKLSPD